MSRKHFVFGEHLQVKSSWVRDSLNLDRFREMIHLFSASSESPKILPGGGGGVEHSMRSPSCPASL